MMCQWEVVTTRVYTAPVGERCEMAFSFHTRFFPVTYLPFAVFCWSVVNGVGYGLW